MFNRSKVFAMLAGAAMLAITGATAAPAQAQFLDENFDGVQEDTGGVFLSGSGFQEVFDWDGGLVGENAFAGTFGNTQVDGISALGDADAGVGGTGAGIIDVAGANFNLLAEDFENISGTGGGVFLLGDGTPNTFNNTTNWDDGIGGEGAYMGTYDGAFVETGGGASADGMLLGGVGNSAAGQLVVAGVDVTTGGWYSGLQWQLGPFPGATPFNNPGFESWYDNGGPRPNDWTWWGNVYADTYGQIDPRSGERACKMFGTFPGSSGMYQDLTAEEGQTWEFHAYSHHKDSDNIVGTANYMIMKLEFFTDVGQKILEQEATILDAGSPTAVWIDNPPLQVVAPPGTATVRGVIIFEQPSGEGGAGFVDDISFHVINGPVSVSLGDFALSADVLGTIISGAGQTFGDYQLRIEDTDGDRLIFYGVADGTWHPIGGSLDTAVEATIDDIPSNGVFNVNSPQFMVVVSFDDTYNSWGTGGTLTVDNLLLTNSDSSGSGWYAGLYWDELSITADDPSRLYLGADVLGNVPDGLCSLRIEGFDVSSSGLDEDFSTVTGTGGGFFLDYNANTAGIEFGFTDDWDDGIAGEGAFGGLSNAEVWVGYGFSANGLTGGGTDGTGSGEIRVEGLILQVNPAWYAGLTWRNQALASTDLSQVELRADIKGTASGGTLGDYELRLEDAQGDRLYFAMVANGSWQSVGGTLDTAAEGAALSGSGDGTFNLDSDSYTVVVSFLNEATSWIYGGILEVDNLYITPADVKEQTGTITFSQSADGSFQEMGGLLSAGNTTFHSDLDEDFNTATGVGGTTFLVPPGPTGSTQEWDTGLTGLNAFAGVWGDAAVVGGVTAQGCTTCGTGGSGAGQLIVDDLQPNTSGWWAGVNWGSLPMDLGNLDEVHLTADVMGTANVAAGESLGTYTLRLEDTSLDYLAFTVTADGTFQSVGGALSGAQVGTIPGGDGMFDFNAPAYTVTLLFEGNSTNWGPGGTLTFDNVAINGVIDFGQAESYTVTLTFMDEVASWGTDGSLTIDNLVLTAAANSDGDNDVDLRDFAAFQRCFTGGGVPGGCEYADLDNDDDIDADDYATFMIAFHGPQ